MPSRTKVTDLQPVVVMETTSNEVVIAGGGLPKDTAWLPADHIKEVDGQKFLVLSMTNYRFIQLCGITKIAFNNVLAQLQKERSRICDNIVMQKFQEYEDHRRLPKSQPKSVLGNFARAHEVDFPTTVDVEIFDKTVCLLFEHDSRKSISLRLDSETVDHVVKHIFMFKDDIETASKKRPRQAGKFPYPEISWNDARNVPCVRWVDQDGKSRYFSQAPKDDSDDAMQECYQAIHAHYVQNAPPGEPDQPCVEEGELEEEKANAPEDAD